MSDFWELPLPTLDALPLGAHRAFMLTDAALFEACGVRIGFTGKGGGLDEGRYERFLLDVHDDETLQAGLGDWDPVRDAACARRYPLVVPKQVHGTRIVPVPCVDHVGRASNDMLSGADAVQVECPGVMAVLHSADCLVLVIVSPSGRFSVVHAGWRGAVGHIAARAARSLERVDECRASRYNVYFSPHICAHCFEVGVEVAGRFREEFGNVAVPDGCHVDLARSVRADLVEAGVRDERIVDSGICTKCRTGEYYSYRASGGRCGRNVTYAVGT